MSSLYDHSLESLNIHPDHQLDLDFLYASTENVFGDEDQQHDRAHSPELEILQTLPSSRTEIDNFAAQFQPTLKMKRWTGRLVLYTRHGRHINRACNTPDVDIPRGGLPMIRSIEKPVLTQTEHDALHPVLTTTNAPKPTLRKFASETTLRATSGETMRHILSATAPPPTNILRRLHKAKSFDSRSMKSRLGLGSKPWHSNSPSLATVRAVV